MFKRVLGSALLQLPRTLRRKGLSMESSYSLSSALLPRAQLGFDIIFEDEHMICVNKPANMLSVPGVASRNLFYEPEVIPLGDGSGKKILNPKFKPRTEKFADAVALTASREEEKRVNGDPSFDSTHLTVIRALLTIKGGGFPRKQARFLDYLKARPFSVEDSAVREAIWNKIAAVDFECMSAERDIHAAGYEPCVPDLLEAALGHRVYSCHRLDQETSGVLVLAKTEDACSAIMTQFQEKVTKKQYIAKVIGRVDEAISEIDFAIRPDKKNRPFQVIDGVDGKQSRTLVKVLKYETLPAPLEINCLEFVNQKVYPHEVAVASSSEPDNSDTKIEIERRPGIVKGLPESTVVSFTTDTVTTVLLEPVTGRTHQLRMHMVGIGHPLIGDSMYAPENVINLRKGRLCLHAASLDLLHPVTQAPLRIATNGVDFDSVVLPSNSDSFPFIVREGKSTPSATLKRGKSTEDLGIGSIGSSISDEPASKHAKPDL